jgi:DHA1 family multidrug resistance protein-like MFS transporter
MGPVWGSIGDRVGRKVMVLRAMLAVSFFVGCIGFVRTPLQLFVLRLCQGVFSGFAPPSITLVSIAAPREVQGRVASSLQASLAVGTLVGPLLGAWVQGLWGIRSIFFVVAALSGCGALLVHFWASEDPQQRAPSEPLSVLALFALVRADLRELLANPRVRMALIVLFCVQLGFGATNPLLELLVGGLGHEGEERRRLTAWLFTATAAAGLVATPVWGRAGDRFGHARTLLGASLAAAVVLGLHAVASAYALILSARVLAGLTVTGSTSASTGVAAVETRAERRGGAFGAMFSARAFAVSLGSLLGGALASVIGIRTLFVAAALVIIAALLALRGRGGAPVDPGALA